MAWFDKQLWSRRRANLEREALAASVEEVVSQNELEANEWDEDNEHDPQPRNAPLIPPRLRLQSRSLPAVRVAPEQSGQEQILSNTNPVAVSQATEHGQRLAGRSTKVRLQAVRPGQAQERITERIPVVEDTSFCNQGIDMPPTSDSMYSPLSPAVQSEVALSTHPDSRLPGGSGVIEQGQGDVTVADASISERSVVMVMLAGDPGPVVVQYVLLHPQIGFTVYLSAPAAASTPFNYVIWPF